MSLKCEMCGIEFDETVGVCPNCNNSAIKKVTVDEANVQQPVVQNYFIGQQPNLEGQWQNNPQVLYQMPPQQPMQVPNIAKSSIKKEGSKGLALFLSVLLFFTSFFACFSFCVRNAFSESAFEEVIEKNEDVFVSVLCNDRTADRMRLKYDIVLNERTAREFFDQSSVKEYFAEKYSDYFSGILGKGKEVYIARYEIEDLIRENSDVIRNVFHVSLSNSEIAEIAEEYVEEEYVYFGDSRDLVYKLKYHLGGIYTFFKLFFSNIVFCLFIVLSGIIIFFMIKNAPSRAATGIGVDLIVLGSLYLLVFTVIKMLMAFISVDARVMVGFIGVIVNSALITSLPVAIFFIIGGAAIFIIRKIRKNRRLRNSNASGML